MNGVQRLNNDRLFSGIFIRWNCLTLTEKVVCTCIILIPLWWLWGWRNLYLFGSLGIGAYEFLNFGNVNLKRPSVSVIGVIAFGLYDLINTYFYTQYNNIEFKPSDVLVPIDELISVGFILWYIQSKNLRVRLQVIAWALSVSVLTMFLFWLVLFFVMHQAKYVPLRSVYGFLTGKGEEYIPGAGNSNYLIPYFYDDTSLPGMVRYVYFFHGPESLAVFLGFICLLALDIKNRLWSSLLFITSFFLLLTSGTRAVWVALPIVLCLRYLLTVGKAAGIWFLCALIAIVSFSTLSVPLVSNLVFSSANNTASATGGFRQDSTEVRQEIYRRTFVEISEASDAHLFLGHVVPGEGVLPGYAPAKVGTHSFILGRLLYRSGLVGTGIFLIFWISLLLWLYNTRQSRPMCLIVFVMFHLNFTTMEMEMTVIPVTLICTMLLDKSKKLPSYRR
ncbi:MAG: hypothetical protein VKL59_26755 [Nostocaceae cyanobacterium]|nr:hypothetical protein [Nostocaceae cyanobacterium]